MAIGTIVLTISIADAVAAAVAYGRDHPDLDERVAASQTMATLDSKIVCQLAQHALAEAVLHDRRLRARNVESLAFAQPVWIAPVQPRCDCLADWQSCKKHERFALYRTDPIAHPLGEKRIGVSSRATRAVRLKADLSEFRNWIGFDYAAWYETNAALHGEAFTADWLAAGSSATAAENGRWRGLNEIVNEWEQTIRLEVTAELLETVFALGDGQRVTWGDATVDQHQQRIGMLMQNMYANAETAARHQAAVGMIEAAGVATLREVG